MITWEDFEQVEMRVGTVVSVVDFPKVRKPAFIIEVDFGDFGVKKTSAQITELYKKEDLVGKQIIGVVNFPPKQIANIKSEFLILGVVGEAKGVVLLQPEQEVQNGLRIA